MDTLQVAGWLQAAGWLQIINVKVQHPGLPEWRIDFNVMVSGIPMSISAPGPFGGVYFEMNVNTLQN